MDFADPFLLLWTVPIFVANFVCGVVGLAATVASEIPRHARLKEGGEREAAFR